MKFVVLKIGKTASTNLNEEEHVQYKNEETQAFKRVILFTL